MIEDLPVSVPGPDVDSLLSDGRYRRFLIMSVVAVSVVAIVPLLILAGLAYHQYRAALQAEVTRPMVSFASTGKQGLEAFFEERVAALEFIVHERSFDELGDARLLDRLLANTKQSFGGFVDLGLLDEHGVQVSYAGPFDLEGRSYAEYAWYDKVLRHGAWVSEVFTGYRNAPHFVIAVHLAQGGSRCCVLRATLDTETINRFVRSLGVRPSGDALQINRDGILQTPSRRYGDPLARAGLPLLHSGPTPELHEVVDDAGEALILSSAEIENSPFTLVVAGQRDALNAEWFGFRRNLLIFLAVSTVLILVVVVGGTTFVVKRARDADMLRAAAYHRLEYTNKMAALGRLSAGVAHEINNPVSIISEKAGLLRDLLVMSKEIPPKEKMLTLVDSVLRSAERCAGVTHRLLGFAKHMEVRQEAIELDKLLLEVLEFLEREASYRNVRIEFDFPEAPPRIVSDRGQLQQVFLNLLNNAFAAVEDGGRIEIGIKEKDEDHIQVLVADDGVGISPEHLPRIFDPFFSTKKGAGTGLGLSITYGIVQKLGGEITVQSEVGRGTCFTITLPKGRRGEEA